MHNCYPSTEVQGRVIWIQPVMYRKIMSQNETQSIIIKKLLGPQMFLIPQHSLHYVLMWFKSKL